MRLPLQVSPSFTSQLPLSESSPSDPPLLFIDQEPFIVELQGKLDLPEGEAEEDGLGAGDEASRLRGSRVGKIDLSDPKKPTMRIAHHRLEGKLETLLTPYALLRTTRRARSPPPPDDFPEPSSKRQRLDTGQEGNEDDGSTTEIHIVGLIRKKIVFNKRPEPLIEISSEADPMQGAVGEGKKEKEAKRGPKGLLGFTGGKR